MRRIDEFIGRLFVWGEGLYGFAGRSGWHTAVVLAVFMATTMVVVVFLWLLALLLRRLEEGWQLFFAILETAVQSIL